MTTQNRVIKSNDEIAKIKVAVEIIDKVFDDLIANIQIGQTEKEVAKFIYDRVLSYGGEGLSFETIVAFGENGAEPHHECSDRKLKKDEFITVDMGAIYCGYCSDFTRTFLVGHASDDMKKIYDIVLQSMREGAKIVKANVKCFDVDKASRDYIVKSGYGDKYIHGTGHGVGLEIHEAPTLNTRSEEVLKNNMVITVEPGIYIKDYLGIRIENMYVVGEDKPLSRQTVELIEIQK